MGLGPLILTRAVGIPGDPSTHSAANASGAVWKSTDGGHIWRPIFDDQPINSIGSIAVAPSDPNMIFVGAGRADGGTSRLATASGKAGGGGDKR